MKPSTKKRRNERRASRRSSRAAFEQPDPRPVMLPRAKMRMQIRLWWRVADELFYLEEDKVSVTICLPVFACHTRIGYNYRIRYNKHTEYYVYYIYYIDGCRPKIEFDTIRYRLLIVRNT